MAVNKNFVVKNGIEVATDLIFASSDLDKVGIGSTIPTKLLEVGGDFKATGNATIVGVATASSFVGNLTGNASGTSGGLSGTPDITVKNITGVAATFSGLIDANGGIDASTAKVEDLTDNRIVISGTGGELEDDANLTFDGTGLVIGGGKHLNVAGIITATGGIRVGAGESIGSDGAAVVYYGDGSKLSDIIATSGGSLGFSTAGAIGYGVTFLKFVGAGVSTLSAPHSGIATLTIVGGGGGGGSANIGVGTTVGDAFPGIVTSGNLWYNTNLARLFIYYFDGSSNQWVDAAPFNIGIITASLGSLSQGTNIAPPLAFSGDTSTGLFSPATAKQTFVSAGASILNVNPGGIEVTGVTTVGIVTGGTSVGASRFYGDGSALTGITAGATLSAGSGSQRVVLTGQTTGSMTAVGTSDGLTYNSTSDTLSATTFSGALSGNASGSSGSCTGNSATATVATNAQGLTGTPDITIRNLTGVAATFTGVVTYEDVTNVDSVGVITARSGIEFGLAGVGGTITADGHAEFAGVCTATKYFGDGSQLSGISVGLATESATPSNTVVTLDLSKQDHKLSVTGVTTITVSGGTEGDSHTVRIINSASGVTIGFSTYFLFPSGSSPSFPSASGAISLMSFTVNRVGAAGTQLLAGASLNFS